MEGEFVEMLTFNSDEKVLILSDAHFGHAKLTRNCDQRFDQYRNYDTTDEMENDIITKWNRKVDENTIVIFLGDFMFGGPASKTAERFRAFLKKMNKPKEFYFIMGNHDHLIRKKVEDIYMQNYLYFKYKGRNYLCQHFSFTDDQYGNPDVLNHLINIGAPVDVLVHGHTHSQQKYSDTMRDDGYVVQNNVSWEAWNDLVDVSELKDA